MRTSKSGAGRPAYYTVREAAWVLGVEPAWVARAIRLGTLPAVWRRGRPAHGRRLGRAARGRPASAVPALDTAPQPRHARLEGRHAMNGFTVTPTQALAAFLGLFVLVWLWRASARRARAAARAARAS